ncbi:hypothetical protein NN561_013886 [Cricetulus griseus]
MQLDVALTFNKQELQRRFMFAIINEHTFYLVAETDADRNRWVQSICQIFGFSQTKESTDTLRNLSSVSHNLCSSPAEFSSSSQPLLRAGSVADSEDVHIFKAPSNTLVYGIWRPPSGVSHSSPTTAPQTPLWGSPQQRPPASDYKYPTRGEETACWSAKSLEKTVVGRSDTARSDDNYVPINPLGCSISDIPMSTMPHHFASRGSEIQPPLVNIHLKPGRKAKPVPLDLSNNTVISELPFKTPVTKSLSTVNHTFNSNSSQYCHSISKTDSRDSEENRVPMQNPRSSSPGRAHLQTSCFLPPPPLSGRLHPGSEHACAARLVEASRRQTRMRTPRGVLTSGPRRPRVVSMATDAGASLGPGWRPLREQRGTGNGPAAAAAPAVVVRSAAPASGEPPDQLPAGVRRRGSPGLGGAPGGWLASDSRASAVHSPPRRPAASPCSPSAGIARACRWGRVSQPGLPRGLPARSSLQAGPTRHDLESALRPHHRLGACIQLQRRQAHVKAREPEM